MLDAMVRNAAALVESEARYRAVVQSALDAIIVIDQLGHIREFNPAAERVFRWRRAQVMGLDIAEVVIPPDLRDGHRQGFLRHLATGEANLLDRRLELVAIRAGGETFPIELTVTRCNDEATPYFTAFIRDLTEQRRLSAAVANHARHDIVTGLDRYAVLEPRLIGMLADRAFVAVMFVDLDRFHGINEAIGHELGDEVLRSVGARLQTFSGEHVAVGHFASDEFIVVQHGGDDAAAEMLAESIRNSLAMPFDGHDYRVLLTATIGMSCAPAHGTTALDVLRRAQVAAERGKSLGRDCVTPFLTEDMQDIEDRVAMGGLLRAAARAGELALHYQPQFAAADGRLTGFETLLRWHSPLLGDVVPARFIPIAEALGLMSEIGNWVVREACRQAREWLDAGQRDFTIAVNVSPQQLRRPGLARAVADALQAFRVPGQMIEIELTESSAMENLIRVQDELAKLKALGLTLSLDDFGTGYSSLAYLKHFALDKLKIDQSFVRGLPEGELDASIARTIVSVGHDLGLLVAAEGVETAAQAEFLHAIGCDELQGFLLGRPGPAATAVSYFDVRPAARVAATPVQVMLPLGVTDTRSDPAMPAAQTVARVGSPWWEQRIGDAVLGTDPRRRIRVAQWLISALVYLASFPVLWFGMPQDSGYGNLLAWGMFVAVGQIAFYAALRGGWSERFADPALTAAQIVFGIVAVDWGYLICGPVRGFALFPLLLIFTFGAFSLSWRRMMWLTAFALTSLLVTVAALHDAWLGIGSWSLADGELRMDLTNVLMCMILLPALSLVATRLSILRSKLRAQRAALTGALAEVQRLATRDELTGLANRRHMQERLDEEQHRSARNGHPFSVAVIDLDHFKRINDAHGHAGGDAVLRGFAADAGLSLRTCDLLARWGGEEFLLLLPETGGSQAQASLLRLLARVRSGPRGIGLPLTFSAGVTEHRQGELVSETVARADRQMYEAKRAGRNTVLLQ